MNIYKIVMQNNRLVRFFSFFACLAVVLGMLFVSQGTALADTDTTTGLGYYISGGNATVNGFIAPSGFNGSLTIPATLGGAPVTSILGSTFIGNESLKSINIPSSVTTVSEMYFDQCINLAAINIDAAHPSYKSIDGVLYNKDGTELLCVPQAKSGSYSIPSTVTTINRYAFEECTLLTSLNIPSGILDISNLDVSDCSVLSSITVDAANPNYKSVDGAVLSRNGTKMVLCPTGRTGSYSIPGSVTSIEYNAFYNAYYLNSLTIPSGVWYISEDYFDSCSALGAIHVDAANSNYKSINGVLFSKDGSTILCCPAMKSGSYSIPNGVTTINSYAFDNCDLLMSVVVPSSVTTVATSAFYSNDRLMNVYFYGNAPTVVSNSFRWYADGFAVRYQKGRTGYTNPWGGATAIPIEGVAYRTHVQDFGWQDYVLNGESSGTSGQSKRLEAINIKLEGISGGIEYRTHVQDIGWQDWVANDALSGTSAQSKRLEAIQIRLTGEAADLYDVYYRVHAQDTGWMDWAKNGASAGTAAYSRRLEAIEIKIVAKGSAAPGATARPFIQNDSVTPTPVPTINPSDPDTSAVLYKTHVQDVGWQDYVSDGAVSGTSARSLRLEGIQIKLEGISGGIEYSTHIQDIGWQGFVANDAMSGTSGQSKRLEAIKIRLTGAAAEAYDIYYCVHAQNTGWLDWAKNGEAAGTAGFSYRLEAIKIVLVPKGAPAPGPTARTFVQG